MKKSKAANKNTPPTQSAADPSDTEIIRLRAKLRRIDDQLLRTVKQRMQTARAIGDVKAEKGLTVRDIAREAFNLDQNRKFADRDLSEEMINEFTELLTNWSRKVQKQRRT
jgi:chorismate mutase